MTEPEIKDLGFEKVKSFPHNQFITNRYEKGVLEIEFTYVHDKLVTCDLTIEEVNCFPITKREIIELDNILNK